MGSDSVRDALESAWEDVENGTASAESGESVPELDNPTANDAVPEPTIEAQPVAEEATKETSSGRDEKGRFLKKEATTEAVVAKPAEAAKAQEQQAQAQEIPPPISWRAEEKEAFKALPKPVQETIARREAEREKAWNRSQMEVSQYRRKYQELDSVLAPLEETWARNGLTAGAVIRNFVAWQKHLDTNPQQALAELAQSYGISPETIGQAAPQIDPTISHLQQQIQQLQQALTTREQSEEQAYMGQVEQGISMFAEEKGADGKPLRPYFNDIYQDMLPIAQALKQANPTASPTEILAAAYDRAVYANPSIRERVIQERLAAEQAKRIADAKTKANAARTAGGSLTNGSGVSMQPNGKASIRETLSQAWDELVA